MEIVYTLVHIGLYSNFVIIGKHKKFTNFQQLQSSTLVHIGLYRTFGQYFGTHRTWGISWFNFIVLYFFEVEVKFRSFSKIKS